MVGSLLPNSHIDLSRLYKHKYSVFGKSICEPLFENFWEWAVSLVPRHVAPNTLTVFGLVLNIFGTLPLVLSSHCVSNDVSPLYMFLYAFCVFGYQTLDAIDGKHARRIDRCSVLGELFDHGCDAISMAILPLGYFALIGIGRWPNLMFVEYFSLCTIFYKYHWQSYVTGIFEFDKLSVTELIMALETVAFLSAFFGVGFWSYRDPFLGFELKQAQCIVVFGLSVALLVHLLRVVLQDGVGKFGTTVANTSVLSPVVPLTLLLGSATWIAVRSPSNIYQTCPILFLVTFGAIFVKLSQNLEVAFVTLTSLPLFDAILLGPACLIVNQMFDCLFNERFLLWLCCIYCLVVLSHFCGSAALQVADHLGIYIFSVDQPPASGRNRPAGGQRQAIDKTSSKAGNTGVRTRGMNAK